MLKLYPPRKGSPNWRFRGKYLGINVERSTSVSDRKSPPEFSPSGKAKSNVVHMPDRWTRHSLRPR